MQPRKDATHQNDNSSLKFGHDALPTEPELAAKMEQQLEDEVTMLLDENSTANEFHDHIDTSIALLNNQIQLIEQTEKKIAEKKALLAKNPELNSFFNTEMASHSQRLSDKKSKKLSDIEKLTALKSSYNNNLTIIGIHSRVKAIAAEILAIKIKLVIALYHSALDIYNDLLKNNKSKDDKTKLLATFNRAFHEIAEICETGHLQFHTTSLLALSLDVLVGKIISCGNNFKTKSSFLGETKSKQNAVLDSHIKTTLTSHSSRFLKKNNQVPEVAKTEMEDFTAHCKTGTRDIRLEKERLTKDNYSDPDLLGLCESAENCAVNVAGSLDDYSDFLLINSTYQEVSTSHKTFIENLEKLVATLANKIKLLGPDSLQTPELSKLRETLEKEITDSKAILAEMADCAAKMPPLTHKNIFAHKKHLVDIIARHLKKLNIDVSELKKIPSAVLSRFDQLIKTANDRVIECYPEQVALEKIVKKSKTLLSAFEHKEKCLAEENNAILSKFDPLIKGVAIYVEFGTTKQTIQATRLPDLLAKPNALYELAKSTADLIKTASTSIDCENVQVRLKKLDELNNSLESALTNISKKEEEIAQELFNLNGFHHTLKTQNECLIRFCFAFIDMVYDTVFWSNQVTVGGVPSPLQRNLLVPECVAKLQQKLEKELAQLQKDNREQSDDLITPLKAYDLLKMMQTVMVNKLEHPRFPYGLFDSRGRTASTSRLIAYLSELNVDTIIDTHSKDLRVMINGMYSYIGYQPLPPAAAPAPGTR